MYQNASPRRGVLAPHWLLRFLLRIEVGAQRERSQAFYSPSATDQLIHFGSDFSGSQGKNALELYQVLERQSRAAASCPAHPVPMGLEILPLAVSAFAYACNQVRPIQVVGLGKDFGA